MCMYGILRYVADNKASAHTALPKFNSARTADLWVIMYAYRIYYN